MESKSLFLEENLDTSAKTTKKMVVIEKINIRAPHPKKRKSDTALVNQLIHVIPSAPHRSLIWNH